MPEGLGLRKVIQMEAKTYCLGCIHKEVCGWYPQEDCDRFVSVEPLTDKEQRIFLAAMCREEKVCKKADEEYYGIDNMNLVRVCREIERKVKKALWT